VERDARRLRAGVRRALERARAHLGAQADALRAQAPWARVAAQRLRLAAAARALRREAAAASERRRARLAALAGRLDVLSPLAVLGRGYAIARRGRDGAIVRSAREVAPGDALLVRVSEGEVDARVVGVSIGPDPPR
jgi:exodeoxyribonuclease VII large subunit